MSIKPVRVLVVCHDFNGPNVFLCNVECTIDQYDDGQHYLRAEQAARDAGYDGPMVSVDECDTPVELFAAYGDDKWEEAGVYKVN
jgi:hypothetical protein